MELRLNLKTKRILMILLMSLLIISVIPAINNNTAQAETDKKIELDITFRDGSTAISGASFSLYMVAKQNDDNSLQLTDSFSGYNVSLRNSSSEWKNMGSTLKGLVERDKITPYDQGVTDSTGKLSFPTGEKELLPGLYLVTGSSLVQNGRTYVTSPFVLSLPTTDPKTGKLEYKVQAAAKFSSSTTPPGGPGGSSVSRKVLKVWDDLGGEEERPKEIKVQLLKNGNVYDTVSLNEENGWRYTWNKLDENAEWNVTEETLESYAVEVYREGITFVVTNTKTTEIFDEPVPEGQYDIPEPPEVVEIDNPDVPLSFIDTSEDLPQTGQLWWPVPLLVMAGLVCMIISLILKKGES